MCISAFRSVTVGVSHLDAALKLFRDVMELQLERVDELPRALLDAWRVPAGVTARHAELSCRGYATGRLRLVEYTPMPDAKVRVDYGPRAVDSPLAVGPKAIDFYVADPIGPWLERVQRAGYPARSAPRRHQIGRAISEEVVVTGPDDLPMLLMVGHRHAATSLRPGSPDGPFSEIATASVICADLDASRRFYGDVLGLTPVNDAETPEQYRDLVCELVDAPRGTRVHFLLYAQPGEASGKILLIHFVGVPVPRLADRMRPGRLGFSLFSHEAADLDRLARKIPSTGGEILTPATRVETGRGVRRLLLARGPNEEAFEFSHPD